MYICVCHAITERDVHTAVALGCGSLRQLREQLDMGKTCGRCAVCAREIMRQAPCVPTHPTRQTGR